MPQPILKNSSNQSGRKRSNKEVSPGTGRHDLSNIRHKLERLDPKVKSKGKNSERESTYSGSSSSSTSSFEDYYEPVFGQRDRKQKEKDAE